MISTKTHTFFPLFSQPMQFTVFSTNAVHCFLSQCSSLFSQPMQFTVFSTNAVHCFLSQCSSLFSQPMQFTLFLYLLLTCLYWWLPSSLCTFHNRLQFFPVHIVTVYSVFPASLVQFWPSGIATHPACLLNHWSFCPLSSHHVLILTQFFLSSEFILDI